jgi:plasmid replication initiation protein
MSEFNKDTEQATMVFSSELAEFLTALKWMYSKIDLKDIGELKGRYALHLFEMAMSYRSLAGKDGNGRGEWYFERSFPEETRFIMGVGDGEHKDNRDLKKNVIDGPLKEINQANIGVKIVPTTVKQKRRIVAIRFDCASEQRRTRGRKKDIEAPVLPEPDHRAEDEREEKELAHLRGIYPVEFAQLYQKALDSIPSIFKHTESSRIASQNKASLELRARHGLVK